VPSATLTGPQILAKRGTSDLGIAGHRDGFFRGLKDVRLGDYVDLYTEKGNTRYVVDEIRIVPPEDVSILGLRSRSSITLVTCYPFYFVGSAPLRGIVHATTEHPINLKISEHQSPSKQEAVYLRKATRVQEIIQLIQSRRKK
jgi:LPXTG-site transpeptidase (sortase) family protein